MDEARPIAGCLLNGRGALFRTTMHYAPGCAPFASVIAMPSVSCSLPPFVRRASLCRRRPLWLDSVCRSMQMEACAGLLIGAVKRYYWHLANDKHLRAQVGADSLGSDGLFACLAGFVSQRLQATGREHPTPSAQSRFQFPRWHSHTRLFILFAFHDVIPSC